MHTFNFENFTNALSVLREKWKEVPGTTQERVFSANLLQLENFEFLKFWSELYENNCNGTGYTTRGWYHDLYKSLALLGGEWLDVGCGLGFDGIFFAENGARVTFLDIVETNLKVVERVCSLKGVKNVEFKLFDDIEKIHKLNNFDVIMAIGSLINAPCKLMAQERDMLAGQLRTGGRWLELCYPKERWEREGKLDYWEWGEKTDGENTPWVEWYDEGKLLNSLKPHKFEPIFSLNFHDNDFNWFDFIKRS